jgi:KaiC/GvpD/RAD55 family RecA-like ATPase
MRGQAANVKAEAIDAALAACATHEALGLAVGVADVLKEHRFTTAFAELRGDAGNFAEGLDYTIRLKRHRVGTAMRRLYRIAQRMVKSPENAVLRANLEVMAKALARTRRKTAEPAPGPVTPAPGGSTSGSKQ